jgi:hypothetical protein
MILSAIVGLTILVIYFHSVKLFIFINEEFHNLYSSPDIIRQIKSRQMRWAGHVARMGEDRKVDKVLVAKPEGKRPLRRPRHRWVDGIRMDLREIGCGVWIG